MNQPEAAQLVNALFDSLGTFLMRYAYRRTHCEEVAEDIVQEAFLALYRGLRAGKRIADARSWTIGAVRNQIRKHIRDSARHSEELLPPEMLDLLPSAADFDRIGEHDTVSAALSVLTPREEEVVLLRLQSLKYREIAGHLGIGTKSVCTLLSRAIGKLQAFSNSGVPAKRAQKKAVNEAPSALQ